MRCDRCSKQSRFFLPYGSHRFCEEHFAWFFESRLKRTIRRFSLLGRKEHLVVALSGGKDSTTALYLFNKFFRKAHELSAVMVDEGIPGYRDKALKIAGKNCMEWGIPFNVFSFRERFGVRMADIMRRVSSDKSLGSSCSFCGPLRRRLLNDAAKELKADKMVLGHNLDDEAQSIAMNLFDNDLARLSRLGAKSRGSRGFVQRIKPLYETPEKEIIPYAALQGLRHYSENCCPFSGMAKRNHFRAMLDSFEEKFPGTKYSILRSFLEMQPSIGKMFSGKKVSSCSKCSEPSSKSICRVCEQLERIRS